MWIASTTPICNMTVVTRTGMMHMITTVNMHLIATVALDATSQRKPINSKPQKQNDAQLRKEVNDEENGRYYMDYKDCSPTY